MKQYPLIAVADTQQRCDLVGTDMFDVPQNDDLSLRVGQLWQERVNTSRKLRGDEVIVDTFHPRHGRGRPPAHRIEAFAEIPLGNPGPLFATRRRSGSVEEHLEQPGLER